MRLTTKQAIVQAFTKDNQELLRRSIELAGPEELSEFEKRMTPERTAELIAFLSRDTL